MMILNMNMNMKMCLRPPTHMPLRPMPLRKAAELVARAFTETEIRKTEAHQLSPGPRKASSGIENSVGQTLDGLTGSEFGNEIEPHWSEWSADRLHPKLNRSMAPFFGAWVQTG